LFLKCPVVFSVEWPGQIRDCGAVDWKTEPTDYFPLADILRLDFAKRFEDGELSSLRPNVRTGGALPKPRCRKNADPSEFVFAPIVLQICGFAFSFLSVSAQNRFPLGGRISCKLPGIWRADIVYSAHHEVNPSTSAWIAPQGFELQPGSARMLSSQPTRMCGGL
jgi:hypothetical protein